MKAQDQSPFIDLFKSRQGQGFIPAIGEVGSSDSAEVNNYRKELHRKYLSGERISGEVNNKFEPVLLAPFLREGDPRLEFPMLYDPGSLELYEILEVFEEEFNNNFEDQEAVHLKDRLEQVAATIRDTEGEDLRSLLREAFLQLVAGFPYPDENKVFEQHCARLQDALLSKRWELVRASDSTVFQLLNIHLGRLIGRHAAFLNELKRRISGLRDLLTLQERLSGRESSEDHFQFAGEILAISKVDKVAAKQMTSAIPEDRLKRIKNCLDVLERARESYQEYSSMTFVTSSIAHEFDLAENLYAARIKIVSNDPLEALGSYVAKELTSFVEVIAAYKMSELELDQQYDEDLHTPYFEHFNFSYLDERDIEFLRPALLIDDVSEIAADTGRFVSLISGNYPVKVLAINKLGDNTGSAGIGQELSALAIFKRNAYVFQGGTDSPKLVNTALGKGLEAPEPSLWNVLFPSSDITETSRNITLVKAAVESRYFPLLEFDPESGIGFGSHLKVDANGNPELDYSEYPVVVKSGESQKELQIPLTSADVLAALPEYRSGFEPVPAGYDLDNLVPLNDYLLQAPDTLIGKMPFVWVVNETDTLLKAVVPLTLLRICREHLDYWRFLQELGGTNSYHTKLAVEEVRNKCEMAKEKAVQDVSTKLTIESETTRNRDLGNAITRMLFGLLEPEKINGSAGTSAVVTEMSSDVIQVQKTQEQVGVEEERVVAAVSAEAWVESDMCTSCSDCIDALPSVFKYNADKQAYVHNPAGGSYAKIVSAAEKCPARCIHPGLPHDRSEPGIDKLIKRAEKYN